MKKLALFLFAVLATCFCHAQDNPYKIFGYKTKAKYETNKIDIYRVTSKDPKSKIRFLEFDRQNHLIKLIDDRDSVLQQIQITDDQLLRWTAIDPLAAKYPSMSPYNFVLNNPMRFIDPTGMYTVEINGDKADDAQKQLQASTSLSLSRDQKTGQLSATGEAKTDADKALLSAINDKNVDVRINATSSNYSDNGHWFVGGSFGGSKVNADGTVVATQTLNPNQTQKIDALNGAPAGVSVMHEVIEAFFGGKNSPGTQPPTFADVENKTPNGAAYVNAHTQANTTDPRHIDPNSSLGQDGVYISKFPYDPKIPAALNPEIRLFTFKK